MLCFQHSHSIRSLGRGQGGGGRRSLPDLGGVGARPLPSRSSGCPPWDASARCFGLASGQKKGIWPRGWGRAGCGGEWGTCSVLLLKIKRLLCTVIYLCDISELLSVLWGRSIIGCSAGVWCWGSLGGSACSSGCFWVKPWGSAALFLWEAWARSSQMGSDGYIQPRPVCCHIAWGCAWFIPQK